MRLERSRKGDRAALTSAVIDDHGRGRECASWRSLRASGGRGGVGFPLAARTADPAGLRADGRPPAALGRRRVLGAGPDHGPAQPGGPLGELDDADGLLAGADPRRLRHRRDHVLRAAPSPATVRARRSPSSTPIPTRTSPRTSRRSTPNTAWPARRRSPWTTWARPTTDAGWALETALDVEWAHAIAPDANIVLVEASSDSVQALFGAVSYASNLAGRRRGLDELGGERIRRRDEL